MKLTGKAKEEFEKWFVESYKNEINYGRVPMPSTLDRYIPSMQYGVYVDFFDSVGVEVDITPQRKFYEYQVSWSDSDYKYDRTSKKDRQEAREQAIKKANEIFNNRIE